MHRKIAVCVLLFLSSPPLLACSCIRPASTDNQHIRMSFEASSAVFSAYVHSAYEADVRGGMRRVVKLRVMQVWKGRLLPNSWAEAISDDTGGLGSCSYVAQQDQALLIYTKGEPPYALTNCSLTGRLEHATKDIPLLNMLSSVMEK